MGFLPVVVGVKGANGERLDKPDVNGDHAPIMLKIGNGITGISGTPGPGGITEIQLGATSSLAFDDHAEFRAVDPSSLVDGEVITFKTPPGSYVYFATDGAGFADDNNTILKPDATDVSLPGRAYPTNPTSVVPTWAALGLAKSGQQAAYHLQAYATLGDGAGGDFDFDPSDTATADDGGIVRVAGERRLRRRFSGSVQVSWFGGAPNARYTHTDGKLYVDSGHTIEASDDAPKIRAFYAYAASNGLVNGELCAGMWYLRTTAGGRKEFATLTSNASLFGQGDATILYVAPGFNVAEDISHPTKTGGYAAVLGLMDRTSPISNVQIRNLCVDHNSAHNQYPGGGFAAVAQSRNVSVGFEAGQQIVIDNVTSKNHNGVFCFELGTYGFPDETSDCNLLNCRIVHPSDDPNVGDTSKVSVGGRRINVKNLILDGSGNAAYPTGSPVTALEVHGSAIEITGCKVNDLGKFLNIAGDNTDSSDIHTHHNFATNVLNGETWFQGGPESPPGSGTFLQGRALYRIFSHHNTYIERGGPDVDHAETGISTAANSALGWADGAGIFDSRIEDNTIICVGTPTTGGSWGISISCNTGDGVHGGGINIARNRISGFGTGAIQFYSAAKASAGLVKTFTANATTNVLTFPSSSDVANGRRWQLSTSNTLPGGLTVGEFVWMVQASGATCKFATEVGGAPIDITTAGTGTHTATQKRNNIHGDVHIIDNVVRDCGLFGVLISGASTGGIGDAGQEAAAVYDRLVVRGNDVRDLRTVTTLVYGVRMTGYADSDCVIRPNTVEGFSSADVSIDVGVYTTNAEKLDDLFLDSVHAERTGIGAGINEAFQATNSKPATGGVTQQRAPSWLSAGTYWDGAASRQVIMHGQLLPAASPVWALSFNVAGGGEQYALTYAYEYALNNGQLQLSSGGTILREFAGRPESAVSGPAGSVSCDKTNGKVFGKHSGSGNTGWQRVIMQSEHTLTNADETITVASGNDFYADEGLLTANRTKTLGTGGSPVAGEIVSVTRFDTSAFTMPFVNGGVGAGTLYTFPVSVARKAWFKFDGTNWSYLYSKAI